MNAIDIIIGWIFDQTIQTVLESS